MVALDDHQSPSGQAPGRTLRLPGFGLSNQGFPLTQKRLVPWERAGQ